MQTKTWSFEQLVRDEAVEMEMREWRLCRREEQRAWLATPEGSDEVLTHLIAEEHERLVDQQWAESEWDYVVEQRREDLARQCRELRALLAQVKALPRLFPF